MNFKSSAFLFLGSLMLSSCGSVAINDTSSLNQIASEKRAKALKEATDPDISMAGKDFEDIYEKNNKIKTIAIFGVGLGWNTKDWKNKTKDRYSFSERYYGPSEKSYADYKSVVNNTNNAIVKKFESLGYKVISSEELAKLSPTYAALPKNNNSVGVDKSFFGNSDFANVDADGAALDKRITHNGEILSKIWRESNVDAFVSFTGAETLKEDGYKEWDDLTVHVSNIHFSAHFTMCVAREKAKQAKVNLGIFGDANHCGGALLVDKAMSFMPEANYKDTSAAKYTQTKADGFQAMSQLWSGIAENMTYAFYKDKLED